MPRNGQNLGIALLNSSSRPEAQAISHGSPEHGDSRARAEQAKILHDPSGNTEDALQELGLAKCEIGETGSASALSVRRINDDSGIELQMQTGSSQPWQPSS